MPGFLASSIARILNRMADGLVDLNQGMLEDWWFRIDSPYEGFEGLFDDAFMHNLEVVPYLVTIVVMIGAIAIPLSKRKDLDYPSLGIGVIKVVLIIAIGRPAIHFTVQITNLLIQHIIPSDGSPMLFISYLVDAQISDVGNVSALLVIGFFTLFIALFGLMAAFVLVSLTKFMVFATYILLPILAPFLVFNFGPLRAYAKPAKIQVGATFALLFMMILFAGYMQVATASVGVFSSEDIDLSDNAEVREAVDGMSASSRASALFVGMMGPLAPLFIAKRFMGAAVSTQGDSGLRGTSGSTSSSSGESATSGGSGAVEASGGGGASGSGGATGQVAGEATSTSAGSAAASGGAASGGAGSGGSAGSLAGPVGTAAGSIVGGAGGQLLEKAGVDQAGAKLQEKGAKAGQTVGSAAGTAGVGAGKAVRHMMANPHGNPLQYGAVGLQHGYREAKDRFGTSADIPAGPEEPESELPAGQPLPAPDDINRPDDPAEQNPIEGTPTDRQTVEGTYQSERTEWGTGNREVGYISPDDAPTALPIRTREGDSIDQDALEDGARVRMTSMERTTTTQGSSGSHSSDRAMPADEDGEEYSTWVPSDNTNVERID